MKHMGTAYQFAHHRTVDGERCLIWGNGIGELLIPVASPEYNEALMDRGFQLNALADEGEQELLETYFRTQAKQTSLFGRLYTTTPTDVSTLTTLAASEVAGTGYAGVTWAVNNTDFPTSSLVGGNWKVTSLTKTYTAGGTWTGATNLVLGTTNAPTNTGKHVAWSALSATRTLANTDTLDVSVSVTID